MEDDSRLNFNNERLQGVNFGDITGVVSYTSNAWVTWISTYNGDGAVGLFDERRDHLITKKAAAANYKNRA